MNIHPWFALLCATLCAADASAQTMVEGFEYATDDDLVAAWQTSGSTVATLSDSVAPTSTGHKSVKFEFNFSSLAWVTETVRGPSMESTLSIGTNQYLTFRLRGDPAFAAADFRNLYLYAYDEDGNFGRWGSAVPITDEWQVFNFAASTIEKPWDATELPDLSRIVRFAFFQYGSEAAIDPYTASVYIDDLMVRDTPLVEFPRPSAPRSLVDDFESYANTTALTAAYTYQNSPAATVTTASLESPAPQGGKALKLAINFAPRRYPWGSVRSATVAPFSLPTNAVVSLRLKGDAALASLADGGTTFWLSFYDKAGRGINYMTDAAPVISPDWTTLEARFSDFGDTSTVDIGNLVQWRILVEAWEGTAEQAEASGAFYVDDIRINVGAVEQPSLSVVRDGQNLTLVFDRLTPGKSYALRTSKDCSQWTTATEITPTTSSSTWVIKLDQAAAFFVLQAP